MKTNLIKRALSLALVLCFMVSMIAFAPVVGAEEPPLTISLVPYKLNTDTFETTPLTETTVGTGDMVAIELVISGYDQWTTGIDLAQFWIHFPNTDVSYFTATPGTTVQMIEGGSPYDEAAAVLLRSDETGTTTAQNEGRTVYWYDAPFTKTGNAFSGFTYTAKNIPQNENFVMATYFFTLLTDDEIEFTIPTSGTDFVLKNTVGQNVLGPSKTDEPSILTFVNVTAAGATHPVPEDWTIQGCTINGELPPVEYTINYNSNGGTGSMLPTVSTNPVVAANTFTRSGYTFNGWNTAANGTGTAYVAGNAITENITLYAQWLKNSNHGLNTFGMLGAQARLTGNPGLRFGVKLDGIDLVGDITQYGMIMIPTDLLDGGELTHDTTDVVEAVFAYAPGSYYQFNDGIAFTAVLINIPEDEEGRDITARSFVVIDGKYYYSDSIVRNFAAVLAAADLT
jgi:uncharacterized repeat protein (TIGR02543 family)